MKGKELKVFAENCPDEAVIELDTDDDEWRELEAQEIRFSATAEDIIAEDEK